MQLLKPLGYTYWPLTIISRSIKFVKEDILSRLPPPLALIMFLRQWKHWSMHQQRDHLCHPQMFAFLHKQMPLISLKWQNASPYSERISHFLNTKGMFHFFSFYFSTQIISQTHISDLFQMYKRKFISKFISLLGKCCITLSISETCLIFTKWVCKLIKNARQFPSV